MTAVDEWQQQLRQANTLTPGAVGQIISVHGSRGRKAITAVGERRVKEYNDFVVVVGHQDEYIVEDDSCECPDARYNLDTEDPTDLCWHAIAVRIARALDVVDEYDLWYNDVHDFFPVDE